MLSLTEGLKRVRKEIMVNLMGVRLRGNGLVSGKRCAGASGTCEWKCLDGRWRGHSHRTEKDKEPEVVSPSDSDVKGFQ